MKTIQLNVKIVWNCKGKNYAMARIPFKKYDDGNSPKMDEKALNYYCKRADAFEAIL